MLFIAVSVFADPLQIRVQERELPAQDPVARNRNKFEGPRFGGHAASCHRGRTVHIQAIHVSINLEG